MIAKGGWQPSATDLDHVDLSLAPPNRVLPLRHTRSRNTMLAIKAEAACRALGGLQTFGGYLCRCPVPTHGKGRGDQSPSLSISDGHKGIVFLCFAGCEPPAIKTALAHLDLSRPAAQLSSPRLRPGRTTTADALALWRSAFPVAGTLASRYLAGRGLPLPPNSFRFLPKADFSPNRR